MTPELARQIHLLARSQASSCFPQGAAWGDGRGDRSGEQGNGGSGGGSASATIAAAAVSASASASASAAAAAAAGKTHNQLLSAFAGRNDSFGTLPFTLSEKDTVAGCSAGAAATMRGIIEQPARSDYPALQSRQLSAQLKSFAPFDPCSPFDSSAPSPSAPSIAPSALFAAASRGPSAVQQPSCGIPPLAVAETYRPVARQPLTRRPLADGATSAEIMSSKRGLKRASGSAGADSAAPNNTSAVAPATATAPVSAARRRGSRCLAAFDGASSGGSSSGGGDSPRAGEEPAEAAEATAAATAAWEQHQWSRGLAELVSADGHRWLKYGAKKLSTKNGGQRRAYYRCAASSPHHRTAGSAPCPARKVVNSHPLRPFDLSAVTVEYLCEHNHPVDGGRVTVARDYKGRRVPRAGDEGSAGEDGGTVRSADVSPAVPADGDGWTAGAAAAVAAAAATGDDRVVSHDEFPFEEDTPQLRDFMGVGGNESSQGTCLNGATEHDISRSNSSVTENCVEPAEQLLLRTGGAEGRVGAAVYGEVDVELHLACSYGSLGQRLDHCNYQDKRFAGRTEGIEGCQTGFKRMRFSEGGCYTGLLGMGAVA
ncbi:unnamed protein product [Closterium sp. Yama58-4]|nr:unnamed protein product [Closterium sp. Yama58-4]